MRPLGERLLTGSGSLLRTADLVCHCLLVETAAGLVLVDTGFGLGDVAAPAGLGRRFRGAVRPVLRESETAVRQIEALGFTAADVTDVVVTHLDLDHIGGIGDFPQARVHVYADELIAFHARATLLERERYHRRLVAHGPDWHTYDLAGDTWHGFSSVRVLDLPDAEIALVPLVGHTRGHCGVAVRTPAGWLLHAGDAYFAQSEVTDGTAPVGLRVFQTLMQVDGRARHENQARLRELVGSSPGEVTVFCAHDRATFERLAAGSAAG